MMLVQDAQRLADRAANSFDSVDFVHSETREALLARLQPIVVDAKTVLDLGTATGSACRLLAKRFRGAHVIGVDVSRGMLERARGKSGWFARSSFIQGDAAALPLADQSVDVVFANLLLPWVEDLLRLFSEVARVLRKDGVFAFSTLGPDSLPGLQQAWQSAFPDMHDVGDAAVRAGLRDPVLDVDRTAVTYESPAALLRDLADLGASGDFSSVLETAGSAGRIHLDLELVYGHCWGAGPRSRDSDVLIDPAKIGRRRD